MSDWGWLNTQGNVGELPVRILEDQRAEFILDFAEDARVASYTLPDNHNLSPGDICILKAEITETLEVQGQTVLDVKVLDVEMIEESENSTSREQDTRKNSEEADSKVQDMMKHLDDARDLRKQERNRNRCSNCRTVSGSTDVTIEERSDGRDLHYCDQCSRLLSTKEYQRWKGEHSW